MTTTFTLDISHVFYMARQSVCVGSELSRDVPFSSIRLVRRLALRGLRSDMKYYVLCFFPLAVGYPLGIFGFSADRHMKVGNNIL